MSTRLFTGQRPTGFPAADWHRERAPGPEPRIADKSRFNAPIVTVLGAGVAGMTAAHELVERGFLVQVVEEREDPYNPHRPIVGGLAANQPARIRGNIEDLHGPLLEATADQGDANHALLATWLLELFVLNRSRWIQTEVPERIHRCLFNKPGNEKISASVVESLKLARKRYRERWLWDLTLRPQLMNAIHDTQGRTIPTGIAVEAFNRLSGCQTTVELAEMLAGMDTKEGLTLQNLMKEPRYRHIAVAAFEREFLRFRLRPYIRAGLERESQRALDLLVEWHEHLRNQPELKDCIEPSKLDKGKQRIPVLSATLPPEVPAEFDIWLEIELIEEVVPGEHGYRFFPSFYRHLEDTMKRIPLLSNGVPTSRTVFDNLKPTVFQGIGMSKDDRKKFLADNVLDNRDPQPECHDQESPRPEGKNDGQKSPLPEMENVVPFLRNLPRSVRGLRDRTDRLVKRLGGTDRDAVLLFTKLFRFMTSSPERRRAEYEGISWAHFLGLDRPDSQFSAAMREQITAAAQALLGFSAAEADARTYGNVSVQLLIMDQLEDGRRVDRTLNGPTTEAWLEPWREYLERQGVRFFCGRVDRIEYNQETADYVPVIVGSVEDGYHANLPRDQAPALNRDLKDHQKPRTHSGKALLQSREGVPFGEQPDFYVLALSLSRTESLLKDLDARREERFEKDAPDFFNALKFFEEVDRKGAMRDMTGVQYFFNAKTTIGEGHSYFPFSEWGLSSISQSEFWVNRRGFSDGYTAVLSVDICTTRPPTKGTRSELPYLRERLQKPQHEVWEQPTARFEIAKSVWMQLKGRISRDDTLGQPAIVHLDQNLRDPVRGADAVQIPAGEFLASLAGLDQYRPGRDQHEGCVGEREIQYSLNLKRWVVCGTFMATYTRMTTMEAANESARHAVRRILKTLNANNDERKEADYKFNDVLLEVGLHNRTFNGAAPYVAFDRPDIWNLEDREPEDLELLRRVDRRLMAMKLKHFMDITKFDDKLRLAMETHDLYGTREAVTSDALGLGLATLDASATDEYGVGYSKKEKDIAARVARDMVKKRRNSAAFPDLKNLQGDVERLLNDLVKVAYK